MSLFPASVKSKRTTNPIRNIVDNLKPPASHELPMINLALGDPTVHGNLKCPVVLLDAVKESLLHNSGDGYSASTGMVSARKSIAAFSHPGADRKITEDDIIITSGCSGAIEVVLSAVLDEGDNVLVPRPGFPLYQVVTESIGASVNFYDLKPNKNWECDLASIASVINDRTKAIVVTNPSNPCGSNYSKAHLEEIVAFARKRNLLIIADEIYGNCVYSGTFTPLASVSGNFPIISVSGLAKQFVVPGWRVGWIVLYDSTDERLRNIRAGMKNLSQLILGASALIQAALPRILQPVGREADVLQQFESRYMSILRTNAEICIEECKGSAVISSEAPEAAMYAMLKLDLDALDDSIQTDTDFSRLLLVEQNMSLLPGACFTMPGFIRMVICPPPETLKEAFRRIKEFCNAHMKDHGSVKKRRIG